MANKQTFPDRMKALRLVEYNQDYQLQADLPVPTPGPRELLIRIAAAGFCHTDYQVFEGAYKTKLPHTGSHEPVGVIASVGSGVVGWNVGDRVGAYLFRKPCGTCNDCKWHASSYDGKLSARYCQNKVMGGILGADGGFAEYMVTSDDAIMKIPDGIPFEQAAPMMCAGATVWTAIMEADLKPGQTLGIVGMGGLGILAVQFAKAVGYRSVAIHHRNMDSKLKLIPQHLQPDLTINVSDDASVEQIFTFTNGIGLDAAVVCTDSVPINDWILHKLHPRGICVVLGLPESGFTFDAFNLVFREIVVKGSLHASVKDMEDMLTVVAAHKIQSQISVVPFEEAEKLPTRVHAKEFSGKPVVVM